MNKNAKKFIHKIGGQRAAMDAQVAREIDVSEFEPLALDLETFRREIPERDYLFHHELALGFKEGFLPSGVPCLMAAPGGCGKTFLLIQAAIAAATGGHWLNAKASKPITPSAAALCSSIPIKSMAAF